MVNKYCIVCGTPIQGRSDKKLCSNACRIALCRQRKKLLFAFREMTFSLPDVEAICAMQSVVDDLSNTLTENN